MDDDTLRIIIVAALLPVAAIAIRLLANLLVRAFPSLRPFHKSREQEKEGKKP